MQMSVLVWCLLGCSLFSADAKGVREYGQALLDIPGELKSNLRFLEARLSTADADQANLSNRHEQPEHSTHDGEDPNIIGIDIINKHQSKYCPYILAALFLVCCCSGAIAKLIGPDNAITLCSFVTNGMLVYLVFSGLYTAWWKGKVDHMTPCGFLCLAAFGLALCGLCLCGCICCGFLGGIWIRNSVIKKFHNMFNEKEPNLPGPRREYYKSDFFQKTCDDLFDKSDTDGNGVLDMQELESVVVHYMGEQCKVFGGASGATSFFAQCFDDNKNSQVEKAEFVELMKFFSVVMLREDGRSQRVGGNTEEDQLRQYFEILQIPPTVTSKEASKAFRKLSVKWHPDKRNVLTTSEQQATADFQELTEAHDLVTNYLKTREGEQPNNA